MNVDSPVPTHSTNMRAPGDDRELTSRARLGESGPVREIIDVAMVGLIGGGPRLAIRAARVLLEDSYASRASIRQGRLNRRMRSRGG